MTRNSGALTRGVGRRWCCYFTSDPQVVYGLGSVWTYLDLTRLGQQGDIPFRRHDEYEEAGDAR